MHHPRHWKHAASTVWLLLIEARCRSVAAVSRRLCLTFHFDVAQDVQANRHAEAGSSGTTYVGSTVDHTGRLLISHQQVRLFRTILS